MDFFDHYSFLNLEGKAPNVTIDDVLDAVLEKKKVTKSLFPKGNQWINEQISNSMSLLMTPEFKSAFDKQYFQRKIIETQKINAIKTSISSENTKLYQKQIKASSDEELFKIIIGKNNISLLPVDMIINELIFTRLYSRGVINEAIHSKSIPLCASKKRNR